MATLLRELPASEWPQARLASHGPTALSNSEVLANVLRTGSNGQDVLALAHRLLTHFGSLAAIATAGSRQLCQVPGIGPAKASQLQAAFELARRLTLEDIPRQQFTSPQAAANFLAPQIGHLEQEHFLVLSLNTRNYLVDQTTLYIGTVDTTTTRIAEIIRVAILAGAVSLIVAHNHPSGDPAPSPEDINCTRQLNAAAQTVGIDLLDHIIIGHSGRWVSFRERGLGFD